MWQGGNMQVKNKRERKAKTETRSENNIKRKRTKNECGREREREHKYLNNTQTRPQLICEPCDRVRKRGTLTAGLNRPALINPAYQYSLEQNGSFTALRLYTMGN